MNISDPVLIILRSYFASLAGRNVWYWVGRLFFLFYIFSNLFLLKLIWGELQAGSLLLRMVLNTIAFLIPLMFLFESLLKPKFSLLRAYPLSGVGFAAINLTYAFVNIRNIMALLSILFTIILFRIPVFWGFALILSFLAGLFMKNNLENFLAHEHAFATKLFAWGGAGAYLFLSMQEKIYADNGILLPSLAILMIVLGIYIESRSKFPVKTKGAVPKFFLNHRAGLILNNDRVVKALSLTFLAKIGILFAQLFFNRFELDAFYKFFVLTPFLTLYIFSTSSGVYKSYFLLCFLTENNYWRILKQCFRLLFPVLMLDITVTLFFLFSAVLTVPDFAFLLYFAFYLCSTPLVILMFCHTSVTFPFKMAINAKIPAGYHFSVAILMIILLGLTFIPTIPVLLLSGGLLLGLTIVFLHYSASRYKIKNRYNLYQALF
jgi:hypothetical protein